MASKRFITRAQRDHARAKEALKCYRKCAAVYDSIPNPGSATQAMAVRYHDAAEAADKAADAAFHALELALVGESDRDCCYLSEYQPTRRGKRPAYQI